MSYPILHLVYSSYTIVCGTQHDMNGGVGHNMIKFMTKGAKAYTVGGNK